jgi:hypothetical protein
MCLSAGKCVPEREKCAFQRENASLSGKNVALSGKNASEVKMKAKHIFDTAKHGWLLCPCSTKPLAPRFDRAVRSAYNEQRPQPRPPPQQATTEAARQNLTASSAFMLQVARVPHDLSYKNGPSLPFPCKTAWKSMGSRLCYIDQPSARYVAAVLKLNPPRHRSEGEDLLTQHFLLAWLLY